MAALTEQGRGQVLSSGSDTGPQITKARRSWCLLFHVHQIISYLKDTRLTVHGLFNPKKGQTSGCYQHGPVGSGGHSPHLLTIGPGAFVQFSSAHPLRTQAESQECLSLLLSLALFPG